MTKIFRIKKILPSHKNLKRKISFGIISVIIVAIFMAPVSGGIKPISIKFADAATYQEMFSINLSSTKIGESSAEIDVSMTSKTAGNYELFKNAGYVFTLEWKKTADFSGFSGNTTYILVDDILKIGQDNTNAITIPITVRDLDSSSKYYVRVGLLHFPVGSQQPTDKIMSSSIDFTTLSTGSGNTTSGNSSDNNSGTTAQVGLSGTSFDCGITNIGGCVAQVFYWLAMAVSWVPTVAGYFLDFFVYYSINSSSYNNDFVKEGWGAVRDIANIFFIIALLYVAIKTILGLNVTDNKKLIGAVIVVALIINFSLFTTKVVIDGSNILAKVFYNNITSKDGSAPKVAGELQDSKAGAGGQKSISVGLVDKFNPQKLIMATYKQGLGYFIFLIILLMIVFLYTAYIFFSVALLFVTRVISLWISMIFSPLAFISYTVPFDIPGFGHKEWWKNLFENAFLAPIFVFMLYIIVLFAGFLDKISYADSPNLDTLENIMQHLMSVLIPFVILVMLLTQAKKLAVKYSGKMGEMITKGGAMVGGLALGAATGGAAMIGGGTIGKYYQGVANNDEIRRKAAGGEGISKEEQTKAQKRLEGANKWAGRSFDIRQTGAGKLFQKGTGLNLDRGTGVMGIDTKTLKGGRHAQQEREKEKGIEKMKTYQMTGDAATKQNDRKAQYKKDKEEAEKNIGTFHDNDEAEFKELYEKGGSLNDYGLNKKVDGGSVQTAEQVNNDRKSAYANSLDIKGKEEVDHAVKTFFIEWRKGMKKMTTTAGGLGTTMVAGAATGGLGAGAVVVGGGFLKALKETMRVRPTNPEVIAAIRKGEDPNKKLIDELKKMTEKGHGDSGKLSDIAKKITGDEKKEEPQ